MCIRDRLKDASATAPYGARGSNGVIVITTKSGSAGEVQFQVSSSYGFQNYAMDERPMLTGNQRLELAGETLMNDYGWTRERATDYVLSVFPGYAAWDAGGRVGPEPRVPFLVDNPGEAKKYFGANAKNNVDYEIIAPAEGGSIRSTKLGRFEDIDAKIKPVDDIEAARLEELGIIDELTNPIAGKYALSDYAQALKEVDNLKKKDLPATLYQNLVLYPKATSQMAKTILAPFTHARNFISAAAFAAANGFVPFGNT